MTAAPQSLNGSGDAEFDGPELTELEAIESAAAVAESLESRETRTSVTLHTGVVLKLRAVPPLAIREAQIAVPPPKIPVVMNEAKGREEENPNDPDYLADLTAHRFQAIARVAETMMLLGTEVDSIPEWMFPPESDEWIEPLEALGMTVDRTNRFKRYLAWLRLYAIVNQNDVPQIMRNVTRLSAVTEEEVQRAAAAFRGSS